MSQIRSTLLVATALIAGVLLAAACTKEAALPQLSLGAADFSFTAPDRVAGGLVHVTLANSGKEEHHAQFARLNDGVTLPQFQQTLGESLKAAATEGEAALGRVFALVTFEGGPASVAPGRQADVVADLRPGQYVLLCFIASPDGVPHLAKGMVKPLTVTAAAGKRPSEPKAKATVEMKDFEFAGVTSLSAGKTTLKVKNTWKEPHEMQVVRLKGITVEQLKQVLSAPPPLPGSAPSGPPPFEIAGGFQAIMPGSTGWTTPDLTAGAYALVCFVPSPANKGAPHFTLGMITPLNVK